MMEAERRGAAIQKELRALDPRVVRDLRFRRPGRLLLRRHAVRGGAQPGRGAGAEHSVIDAKRAAVIALEICEQLAKFHACQSAVVHGDIKPSNIHLGPNDTVRLLDFGIAKTLRRQRRRHGAPVRQPGLLLAGAAGALARWTSNRTCGRWARRSTKCWPARRRTSAEDTRKLESLIRSRRPPRALPAGCPRGAAARL